MTHHLLITSLNIYLGELDKVFIPHIFNGIKQLYKQSITRLDPQILDNEYDKDIMIEQIAIDKIRRENKRNKLEYIENFQKYLQNIDKISIDTFEQDLKTINSQTLSKMNTILTQIFERYVKINLVSHGFSHRISLDKKDIEVPTLLSFVRNIYVEVSKILIDEMYLFDIIGIDILKIQKHNHKVKKRIKEAIRYVLNYYVIKSDIKTFEKYIRQHKDMDLEMNKHEEEKSKTGAILNVDNLKKLREQK
jgi:hypothetical protein